MAQPHARSGDPVSIAPLGPRLATSTTSAIIKADQLEVLRLVLHAGKSVPEHRAPGEITVLCTEGSVAFSTPDKTTVLNKDDLLHLNAGVPHALKAITNASLVVTICIIHDKTEAA